MRMPEKTRESHQLNQLASKLQDEAEITGVNASGTQISSRAFEMNTEYEPAGDQPEAIKKLVDGVDRGLKDQLLLLFIDCLDSVQKASRNVVVIKSLSKYLDLSRK